MLPFRRVVRRVLEIGSGSIKCEVAEVDVANNRIHKSLFSQREPILYLADMMRVADGVMISFESARIGLKKAQSLLAQSNHLQAQETTVVCTEVFRLALNGEAVAKKFEEECNVPVTILPAELEARVGFECARALTSHSVDELIAWDCGAGSFQLSNKADCHFDQHGSGTIRAVAASIENVMERPALAQHLLQHLHQQLKPLPHWLQKASDRSVVAVGSSQSIFNQQRVLSGLSSFSQLDVERTLKEVVAAPEAMMPELERVHPPDDYDVSNENAPYVLPKLCLLLGIMRHARIEEVSFKQTNGNCAALLTKDSLWGKKLNHTISSGLTTAALPRVGMEPEKKLLTLNWHLEKNCNYKCSFCYAHFGDVVNGLSEAEGLRLIQDVAQAGFFKVNFAGGEPLLNQHLGSYLKAAKQLGLKTSIITNASRLTTSWLWLNGPFLDQVGVSCDSLDDGVNKTMGRGFGNHVQVTERAFQRVHKLNQQQGLDVKMKLNTVVMAQNHHEDWSEFILRNGVQRWKMFKVLRIEGENDEGFDEIAVSDEQFQAFVDRHAHLLQHGVVMAPEDNDAMTSSYLMVTPDGRFYQNSSGQYSYSSPILDVGINEALRQTGFEYAKFQGRGGEYEL